MTIALAVVTLDRADVAPEAEFWSGRVEDDVAPARPDAHGGRHFHVDLGTDDLPAAEKRAVGLGATVADPQCGETWRDLLSPAGHPFRLTDAKNGG